ncbi:hypothetical protein [Cryptosporangium phraense]|uniref:Uncharacterized protein n=1 Tax=Cryptosporangium phraense TaxID=2593070 RepID=A0A545ASQ2_9ACTN|nr:hypothetical protein [Cryptosporangium phraense]TQS44348.1 hypothetical protein FL583_15560 [Cryptosporangium phraense]
MFIPTLDGSRNAGHTLELDSRITRDYFGALAPVDIGDIDLAEAIHTLNSDAARFTVGRLSEFTSEAEQVAGWFRDAAGTLVAHKQRAYGADQIRLLWPVLRSDERATHATAIEGGDGWPFLRYGSGPILPLAAVSVDRATFGWGYSGSGPINLYKALVYAVTGEVVDVHGPELNKLPNSLYGWITRLPNRSAFLLPWRDLVDKVRADEPIRSGAIRPKDAGDAV